MSLKLKRVSVSRTACTWRPRSVSESTTGARRHTEEMLASASSASKATNSAWPSGSITRSPVTRVSSVKGFTVTSSMATLRPIASPSRFSASRCTTGGAARPSSAA
jgi:hypothetical protein